MKFFSGLFAIAAAVAIVGTVALYGISLRKSLMGNYEQIMSAARSGFADFSAAADSGGE